MTNNRITIRNIDPKVLQEARQIVRDSVDVTMGSFIAVAIAHYIKTLPFEDDLILET